VLSDRLGTEARGEGQLLDRTARRVDEGVEDPPIQARESSVAAHRPDTPPRRLPAEEPPEGLDRGGHVVRPELDRDATVELPCDPGDIRRVERTRCLHATPFSVEVDEDIPSSEDRGIDRDPVPLEDAPFFQAVEPLADGRWRQRDAPAERLQALPRVSIEGNEKPEILRVHALAERARPLKVPESKAKVNARPNPRSTVCGSMDEVKIAVVGSTGRTGRLVLNEGLRRGYAMTAFTRHPDALAGIRGLKAVVSGDGRDFEDMRRAVSGQDAIISIVSSEGFGPTTVMSDVMRSELAAMREAGVHRLVAVSVSAIEGRRPWILINLVRWILRKPYADFSRMERLVRSSGFEWTIVRPPRLTNGPATGAVRSEAGVKELRHGPYRISRADLAATLLDLAADPKKPRNVLLVSEAKRRTRGVAHSAARIGP
jgi:putative NADH-flavin reductase